MQKLKINSKIILTGGHAGTTAFATIQEIKKTHPDWEIFWIGSESAIEGRKIKTLESEILPAQVKVISIPAGRIQRKFTRFTIPSLFKIPGGFFKAFINLLKIKPKVVLSFGGFASYPVALSAWILNIPVILHEQTGAVGRANKFSVPFAVKIAISRPESKNFFNSDKVILTGNPVRKEIFEVGLKKKMPPLPTVFITGGSRGSQTINEAVFQILPDLLTKYKVIHQTGEIDFEKFKDFEKLLPSKLKFNYKLFSRIDFDKMPEVYRQSDVIVARAGANTVSEIMIVKRPAILVPLSISYLDEQTKNAEIALHFGVASVVPQEKLTPGILENMIDEKIKNFEKIVKSISAKKSPDFGAAQKLVGLIADYV